MKLYIANVMRQTLVIYFRVPGENGVKQHMIPPGSQRMIFSPDLTQEQIDGIIEQNQKYGICSGEDYAVKAIKNSISMVYSINRPVNFARIQKVLVSNHDVLVKAGERARKEAAVLAHHIIENPTPDVQFAKTTDVEIVEQPVKRGESIDIDDHMTVTSQRRAPDEARLNRAQRRAQAR